MQIKAKILKIWGQLSFVPKALFVGVGLFLLVEFALDIYKFDKESAENVHFLRGVFEHEVEMARYALGHHDPQEVCVQLQDSYGRKLIAFYILQLSGKPVCYSDQSHLARLDLDYHEFDKIIDIEGIDNIFESIKSGNVVVTVGAAKNTSKLWWAQFQKQVVVMAEYFLFTILVLFVLFKMFSKPLQQALLSLKTKGWIEGKKQSSAWNFREIDLIAKASEESHNREVDLQAGLQHLTEDLSTHLRMLAVKKSHHIPYKMQMLVTRMDLNNFTKLTEQFPDKRSNLVVPFVGITMEYLKRYGGFHYSYAGDELVSGFLNEDRNKALRAGMALIRDVFIELAQIFPNAQLPVAVTAKGSMGYEEALIEDTGVGLKPQAQSLIYTQRILQTVEDKTVSKLLVLERDARQLEGLAKFGPAKSITMKGLEKPISVVEVISFLKVEDILRTAAAEGLEYFKGNRDVTILMKRLSSAATSLDARKKIIEALRDFEAFTVSQEVVSDWAALWSQALLTLDRQFEKNSRELSSLILLGVQLVPKIYWTRELNHMLLSLKCLQESRCRSSMIHVLAMKNDRVDYDSVQDKLAFTSDNSFRPVGNFLLGRGKFGLSDNVFTEFEKMINSVNPFEIASGVYGLSELIQFYKEKDPVVLSQYDLAQKLVDKISQLQEHENEMVRARAKTEIEKLSRKGFHAT